MKRTRGRHVGTTTDRVLNTDELKIADEGTIVQYAVYGSPGGERHVKRFRTPLAEMHPLTELTGTISLVQLDAHGDGTVFLQVNGYSIAEAETQWDIAAATIGTFQIKDFPAPAMPVAPPAGEQIMCSHCGGRLLAQEPPDSAVFLHENGNGYCPEQPGRPPTGEIAQPIRLQLHTNTPATGTAAIPLPDLTAVIPPLDLNEDQSLEWINRSEEPHA